MSSGDHRQYQTGFFGKLPCRGDFVARRLDQDFRSALDAWLGAGLIASRQALGQAWIDAYLVAPIWRFAMEADVCGASPAIGVMMPSLDRAGRHFPLVIAAQLPAGSDVRGLARDAGQWFEQAEAAALACLEDDADFASFDDQVAAIPHPAVVDLAPSEPARPFRAGQLDDAPFGLWWTLTGGITRRAALLHAGMPDASHFAAFLDTAYERWGWRDDGESGVEGLPLYVQT